MDLNRNQYFMIGVILLLLGLQFRLVDSYVLNEKSAKFIAEKLDKGDTPNMPFLSTTPVSRRVVKPPAWLGWVLMSIGAVLVLQSLAMKKPG